MSSEPFLNARSLFEPLGVMPLVSKSCCLPANPERPFLGNRHTLVTCRPWRVAWGVWRVVWRVSRVACSVWRVAAAATLRFLIISWFRSSNCSLFLAICASLPLTDWMSSSRTLIHDPETRRRSCHRPVLLSNGSWGKSRRWSWEWLWERSWGGHWGRSWLLPLNCRLSISVPTISVFPSST